MTRFGWLATLLLLVGTTVGAQERPYLTQSQNGYRYVVEWLTPDGHNHSQTFVWFDSTLRPGQRHADLQCADFKRLLESLTDANGNPLILWMDPERWDGVDGSRGEYCYLRR